MTVNTKLKQCNGIFLYMNVFVKVEFSEYRLYCRLGASSSKDTNLVLFNLFSATTCLAIRSSMVEAHASSFAWSVTAQMMNLCHSVN